MMKKCTEGDCTAPKGICLKYSTPEYQKCEHWLDTINDNTTQQNTPTTKNAHALPWKGIYFQPEDIEIISQRSTPLIIGMVGSPDAGKTSYLGMLYTLLFNGKKFKQWSFAGSYTLSAWESLAQYLKIRPNGKVEFPPTTPSNPDFYSLYHLFLKKDQSFKDILFADSSGEVFNYWSKDINDPSAKNAQWIYENASAFIFMVDSVALIERKGVAVREITSMAGQLEAKLNNRPVAIVWTKADRIDEVRDNIKKSLARKLSSTLPEAEVFEVSNFSKSEPDQLCHKNNMAVTEYLLTKMNQTTDISLIPQANVSNDLFFKYRGKYHNG